MDTSSLLLCIRCHLPSSDSFSHCERCGAQLSRRKPNSLQTSWIYLCTAFILLFPANLYPITELTKQGVTTYDTIFSGILSLIELDMVPIAIIVFAASILVPWLKIIGIFWILISIHSNKPINRARLLLHYRVISWIGRWSMLDLFVISIVVAVVNMGQLLDAKPEVAASAFAAVILFTQLAAKAIDTRLIWDKVNLYNEQTDQRNPI